MTNCPECDAAVDVTAPVPGEIFPCRDCGTELEVTGTEPIVSIERAPKEAEDWGE